MIRIPIIFLWFALLNTNVSAFFVAPRTTKRSGVSLRKLTPTNNVEDDSVESKICSRRGFVTGIGALSGLLILQQPSFAIPMVTKEEFDIILKDSSLSIEVVEFSGPKSETVTVRLVDGTSFGIKDIVESSTDPRSPLRISAICRENNVKTRFVDIEKMLSSSTSTKRKVYSNQRVREAAEKEKAKRERMRQDEEDRLEQLRRMEEAEAEAERLGAANEK